MEISDGMQTSVLVVVDYPLLRRGAVATLAAEPWLRVCGETGDAARARQLCAERQPELAVVDLELEQGDGLALLRELAVSRPGIGLLAVSEREESAWVRRAFRAGARGVISKRDSTMDFATGLWRIYNDLRYVGHRVSAAITGEITGESPPGPSFETLSNRELTVLQRVAAGEGPRKIAEGLRVEVTTVETHLSRIKRKLSPRSGGDLKRMATRWALKTTGSMSSWLAAWMWAAGQSG